MYFYQSLHIFHMYFDLEMTLPVSSKAAVINFLRDP